MKTWIDTDIGDDIDDALTLLLAAASDEAELLGIGTVFGNTAARATIAKKMLNLMGRNDIPVYAGQGVPKKNASVFGKAIDYTAYPISYSKELYGDTENVCYGAVEALRDVLDRNPNEIHVVATGALTNIALLIEQYPDSALKMNSLYIMGGAVSLNFNEYNFTCDPEAVQKVLEFPIKKKIVTFDMTSRCTVNAEQIKKLNGCQSEVLQLVKSMSCYWGEGMMLHDPLTFATLLSDDFVTFKNGNIYVETSGNYSRGKCVNLCDFNWKYPPKDDLLISVDVKKDEFVDFYVNRICKLDKVLNTK